MESFELVKRNWLLMGISEWKTKRERLLCISRMCGMCTIIISFTVSTSWFLSFEAETFHEYSECSYMVLSCPVQIIWYSTQIWQFKYFSELFTRLNDIIDESINFNSTLFEHVFYMSAFVDRITYF